MKNMCVKIKACQVDELSTFRMLFMQNGLGGRQRRIYKCCGHVLSCACALYKCYWRTLGASTLRKVLVITLSYFILVIASTPREESCTPPHSPHSRSLKVILSEVDRGAVCFIQTVVMGMALADRRGFILCGRRFCSAQGLHIGICAASRPVRICWQEKSLYAKAVLRVRWIQSIHHQFLYQPQRPSRKDAPRTCCWRRNAPSGLHNIKEATLKLVLNWMETCCIIVKHSKWIILKG